jgi:REP element-mobilizing transposase RayT
MTTARALLVDPDQALNYHLVSRCVRRAWLCGWDTIRRKDCTHRKDGLEKRLFRLVRCFAVELHGFAIMSNHFHLVVRYDPLACDRWSPEEVAERWVAAIAPASVLEDAQKRQARVDALCAKPDDIERVRQRLGSLSAFMQHLKQPIARLANSEDEVKGHFFEQRFYSGALLCEEALLAAMAYVDLNPVRAKLAKDIEHCDHTSIAKRLEGNSAERLEQMLRPLASGLDVDEGAQPLITLQGYVEVLHALAALERPSSKNSDPVPGRIRRWVQQVATLAKRQRAFGHEEQLKTWLGCRNMKALEIPFA